MSVPRLHIPLRTRRQAAWLLAALLLFAACSDGPLPPKGPSLWERTRSYFREQAAWIRSQLPWTEPDLTGEWKGFVRLTAGASPTTYRLVQTGQEVAGTVTVEGDSLGYPVRGTFANKHLKAIISVSHELCEGEFAVEGDYENPYLRLSGSGSLCGLRGVTIRTDLKREVFILASAPEPSPPPENREAVHWIDGAPDHYPQAMDFYPVIDPLTDVSSGQIRGFTFEISSVPGFPVPTRCERIAPPAELCESEGGLVPNERPAWPLENPAALDWAVIDLDRLAASGPSVEKVLTPRGRGFATLDSGYGLQQLISGPADDAIEVLLQPETPEIAAALEGSLSEGRYFPQILGGNFRPFIYSRMVGTGEAIRLAKGSLPLANCDFTRRCRGEYRFSRDLLRLDLANHPNLMLAARVRTGVTKPWFSRPFVRETAGRTFELASSFHPPEQDGKPYPVYSAPSLSPLSQADVRIDYPLVTFQMDSRNRVSKIGVRISVAQIVNSLHVAAPRFPSFAEADAQILPGSCIDLVRPEPAAARQACQGLLDRPRVFTLRIPEKPDMPLNPPRDGLLDLTKDAWDHQGKARWSLDDWLSLTVRVRGTSGRETAESYLVQLRDAQVSAEKLLRFVATPRVMEVDYTGGEVRRDYKIEGVLVTGDRVDLTLDPDTIVKVSPVSLPAPELHVSPGTLMIHSPGISVLRFYHRKYTLMPAEMALVVKDPAAPDAGPAGPLLDFGRSPEKRPR